MTVGRQVVNPTIVLGLGSRGAAIVTRLEADGGALGLLRLIAAPEVDGSLAARLAAAFDELLSLEATAQARASYGRVAPVDLFVVARLGDPHVSCQAFKMFLAALDEEVAQHGALLQRADGRPRLHVSPILLLPPMPRALTAPDAPVEAGQAQIIELVRQLGRREAGTHAGHLGRVYLVEQATRDFTLSETQRESMTVSFLTLLLFGSLRSDEAYASIYEADGDPFASFLLARVGLPLADLRPWCHAKVRLSALEAFAAPREDELVAEATADLDVFEALDLALASVERDARPALDSLATQAARAWGSAGAPARIELFEGPGAFSARAGEAWLADRLASGERAWGLLQGSESGQRALVEAIDRDGAEWLKQSRRKVRDYLVKKCLGPDAPGHHRDGLRILGKARESVRERLAIEAATAHAVPAPPRALDDVRAAHATLLAAVGAKPEPRFLLGFGAALLTAIALVAASAVGRLLEWNPLAAAGLIALAGVVWLVARLHATGRPINRALAADGALGRALAAVEPELRATLKRRAEIARAHGAARLLTRHLAWLDAEAANLGRAEDSLGRALMATRSTLAAQSEGPDAADPRVHDDPLERSLLPPSQLRSWCDDAVVAQILGHDSATRVRHFKRLVEPYREDGWASAFERLTPLDAAVDRGLASLTLSDVLADAHVGPEAQKRMVATIAKVLSLESIEPDKGARLQLPLEMVSAPTRSVSNRIIAHDRVVQALREHEAIKRDQELERALEDAKSLRDPARAYVLRVSWSIPASAIAWLGDKAPSNVVVLADRRNAEAGRS